MSMTQPADLVRGSRPCATVSVGVEQGRLWVYWRAADRHIWEEIFTDFRAHFHRHRDAVARGRGRGWSLPLHHRERLAAWVAVWFAPEQVSGSFDEDEERVSHGEDAGMPAESGELVRLLERAEALRKMIRGMPGKQGPVYREVLRELAATEERVAQIRGAAQERVSWQGVEG